MFLALDAERKFGKNLPRNTQAREEVIGKPIQG